ncbi:hypothetical protein EC991_002738 [Linnemannia zychae]|nr:hypothetical protein EC991_002738 [Linnemannia zychae]
MTFSGLLNKTLKHHGAASSAAAAAASSGQTAKPVSVNTAPVVSTSSITTTAATTTVTTTAQEHTFHANLATPKTDSAPEPGISMTSSSAHPQPTSIDPTALSIEPRSPSPSQLETLSSQPTASTLDMKQPTPLSPPSTTPSSPTGTCAIASITKKKPSSQHRQQQTLSPTQNASYRKRLNVNQVCDWCRYRKIRCDRESPCNSCQHSKRECIRTPPEVLLSKLHKETKDSSSVESTTVNTTPIKATKRNSSFDDQDDLSSSLKMKKIARSNSVVPSNLGVDNNNNNTILPPSSAMMGPLTLSPPSTMGLSLCGEQQQQSMTTLVSGVQGTPAPKSLQDQEHLERMRRIEMLLSNVIPGAAAFIAHGRTAAVPSDLVLEKQMQQQQQHNLSPISPALTALGSPLGLKPIQGDECSPLSSLSPIAQADDARGLGGGEDQDQGRRLSVFAGQEYIERMKRIELLLGSVQGNSNDNTSVAKLSLTVPSTDTIGVETTTPTTAKKTDDSAKGEPTATRKAKATGSKKVARNSDGTVIKRPHVAAGFAGQKPPPKLPQAIAEAALKKLAGKKKKRAASSNASAASPTPSTPAASVTLAAANAHIATAVPAISTTSPSTPAQTPSTHGVLTGGQDKAESPVPLALSSPKSFDTPSTIDHHQLQESMVRSFTQHQTEQQPLQQQKDGAQILARQQQPRPSRLNTHLRGFGSFHPHHNRHRHHQNAPYTSSSHQHSQAGPLTNIGSISIPTISLSNAMASYESLVVPACNSTESSPASSPKITNTTIELPVSSRSVPTAVNVPAGSTMDFLAYETSPFSPFSGLHSAGTGIGTNIGGGSDFAMAINMLQSGSSDHQLTSPIDGTAHSSSNNQPLLPFGAHPAPMFSHHSHHLQQQQQHQQQQSHHALHIPQDAHPMSLPSSGMPNFAGLQMTESLESWMNNQLVIPPQPLDGGFMSPTDGPITSPLAAHHGHSSPVSPQPIMLLGGDNGGFRQRQQLQLHQQSFYIPQSEDDTEDVHSE